MSNETFDPSAAVFTPPQVATAGIAAIEKVKNAGTRTLRLGIPEIQDYFAPMLGGQICAVIAQTSNFKSGTLHSIESNMAQQLADEGRNDEALVHVSVEEGVEEQAFYQFARESGERPGDMARGQVQDWDKLMRAAVVVSSIPIFRIGDSLARADDMPNLYLSNMLRSLDYLQMKALDKPLKFAGLFFDYLQAFPIDPETKGAVQDQQRRLQVRSDIYRLRQAAAKYQCPVFVAVQAKQHLEGATGPNMLIPGIYDGEESSSIAQRCDRIICQWMPKQTHTIGTDIQHKDKFFKVDENLLFVKVAKQRGGLPSGRVWKCRIDFSNYQITPEEW